MFQQIEIAPSRKNVKGFVIWGPSFDANSVAQASKD